MARYALFQKIRLVKSSTIQEWQTSSQTMRFEVRVNMFSSERNSRTALPLTQAILTPELNTFKFAAVDGFTTCAVAYEIRNGKVESTHQQTGRIRAKFWNRKNTNSVV